MPTETFWDLVVDVPHWQFEVLTSVVFALIEGIIIYPLWKKWRKHHIRDDEKLNELEKRILELEHDKTS